MKNKLLIAMTMSSYVLLAGVANTVKVTKFHQAYPYSGRVTVEYTVGGTLPANAVAEIILNTDDASATFVQSNIVTGANTYTLDFASSFGGALLLTNAAFVVTITGEAISGVQLWENGPYWAECNVGASKPEEYGYYFWWGDTVGYTNTGNGWISVKDGTSISFINSGPSASTYGNNSELLSAGYIDATGNLVPEHDAATAHLGSQWRMPTIDEIRALVRNCTTTWITINGINGRMITGKDNYANRSIFLPAAGYGSVDGANGSGWNGFYWSSSPNSAYLTYTWILDFDSSNFSSNSNIDRLSYGSRDKGLSVRPVRGFAQ